MDRANRECFYKDGNAFRYRMMRFILIIGLLLLTSCSQKTPDKFGIETADITSGFEFLTAETQALQEDSFANPGLLWAEKGKRLFGEGTSKCSSCHENPETDFGHLASAFPAIDPESGQLINLEGRINLCRTRHQSLTELPYESEDLLALTTYLKSFSRGTSINYEVTEELQPFFKAGQDYFFTQRGQLNLSCHQCHDRNWGAKMRGDTLSQGHINGFPAYRNDWQSLGSSHRRFEACDIGVRAEPYPLGSQSYIELEVYLNARGNGLINESPAIRR